MKNCQKPTVPSTPGSGADAGEDVEKLGAHSLAVENEHRSPSVDDSSPFPNPYQGLLSGNLPQLPSDAAEATRNERRLTFRSALVLYCKAIGWSAAISFAIIMEGFGTALLNSFFAFPQFQRQFGTRISETQYEVPTNWQQGLSNAAAGSAIIGILANGLLTARFGYRWTMIGSLLFLSISVFALFFGHSLNIILVGQVLCGLSWGVFSTLTTTYAAEVLPVTLRGFLIASVNLCWLLGQIIAAGTLRGFIDLEGEWSYRIPFALQWVFIFLCIVMALLAPESPWWEIQRSRPDNARKSLLRLTRRKFNFDVDATVTMMSHTDEVEKEMSDGRSTATYLECFRGTNLRRTEIACMVFMIQNASGLPLISFAAYFYNRIGFDQRQAFDLTVGMQGVAILGNLLAFVLMQYFGRRTLYLAGLGLQLTVLLAAGIVSIFQETKGTLWAMAALVIVFIFIFDVTVGPMTYCLVAELPSSRMRVKTVALARVSYNLCALVTNVLQTNMLNPLAWNWRGKSNFFWAGICLLCLIYCFFRLPETKGLTYLELDLLFEKKAHATKFAEVQKHLAETGYFSLEEEDSLDQPRWVERSSISAPTGLRP